MPGTKKAILSAVLLAPALVGVAQAEEPGAEIEIEGSAAPAASGVPAASTSSGESPSPGLPATPVPSNDAAEDAELRATVDRLLERISALESERSAPVAEPPPPPPPPPEEPKRWQEVLDLRLSGFIQPQLAISQLSQDAVSANGTALNQDQFVVRRGRVEIERFWKYAYTSLEIDMDTVHGPRVSLAGAEVAGFLPSKVEGQPPLARVGAGFADIPFGFELPDDSEDREFMERTLGSRAFFLGISDVGVQLSSALGPLRFVLAGLNGVPITPDDSNTVWNGQKTLVGRVGFDGRKEETFTLRGGVSFLKGTGFHEGTTATKSQLLWSDVNQDGTVTLNELTAINGQAATPSATFDRWAVNADLGLGIKSPLGWSRVYGEVTIAANLDRGYLVADPIATGYDVRELSWYVAAVQDVTPYALVGFRADSYQPNSDLFEARRGLFLPQDASVLTLSPLIGGRIPGLAKLYLQYDYVVDLLGRDERGEPEDLANDQWTLRAQVEF